MAKQRRVLSGDTPTGQLHLGHWVGSVQNRVAMQSQAECFFLLADAHALTTRVTKTAGITQSVRDITLDYLACGIDPEKSTLFVESHVPAIYQLSAIFSMLLPYTRVMRNPTIKDEIRDKQLGDTYSFGFLLYPVMQVADILAFRADDVPVGEDQVPHLEMTREVARRFNQLYCGVDSHAPDEAALVEGGLFPVPQAVLGETKRLVGLGGPDANGKLLKMSKSLNNAICLSATEAEVKKAIMGMYTDPTRLRATDPGTVENNPLWIMHDVFNPDKAWVEQAKADYRAGQVGDVTCKKQLITVINDLLLPFRERRAQYMQQPNVVVDVLAAGADKANAVANDTLEQVMHHMKMSASHLGS